MHKIIALMIIVLVLAGCGNKCKDCGTQELGNPIVCVPSTNRLDDLPVYKVKIEGHICYVISRGTAVGITCDWGG